jgi:shikimate kinase
MGSGKSTLGKKIATALRFQFIDTDEYIESKANKSIPQIFESEGESKFRELETEALLEIYNLPNNKVIALGGGSLLQSGNLDRVKSNGLLVYLQLPETTLFQRLQQQRGDRPLLTDLDDDKLRSKVKTLFAEREPIYLEANLIVPALDLDSNKLQKTIREKLGLAS